MEAAREIQSSAPKSFPFLPLVYEPQLSENLCHEGFYGALSWEKF